MLLQLVRGSDPNAGLSGLAVACGVWQSRAGAGHFGNGDVKVIVRRLCLSKIGQCQALLFGVA